MRVSLLNSLILSAACTAFSARAWAAGAGAPPVHVLEIATDDADDQAKAVTMALKGRVKASKDYALAEGDHSLGVMVAALRCNDVPDANCQNLIGEKLSADRYIWGVMKKTPDHHVALELHLWQKGQPDIKEVYSFSDNLTEPLDPSLQRLAEQMIQKLTQHGKVGSVRIAAEQSIDGELFVDSETFGRFTNGSAELVVPIGEHHFIVKSAGQVVAEGHGTVASDNTIDVQLGPPVKTQIAVSTSSDGSWKKTAGYVGVGVGAVAIAGGLYSMLKVNSYNSDDSFKAYRGGFSSSVDICQQAKAGKASTKSGAMSPSEVASRCDSVGKFETLQWVLIPVGGVLAAAGAYFLVTGDGEQKAPQAGQLQVIPSVGPGVGSVDVHLTF